MRRLAIILFIPALAGAQDMVARGQDVFNKTCATGYCHGVRGTAGGAPKLASRGFDQAYIAQVVRAGIPGTGMPAFGTILDRLDMFAVTTYVGSLNGIPPAAIPGMGRGPAPRKLPPEALRGRALFYDAVRGFDRCSTCHQVDGMGIAVTDPIAKIPENAAGLRAVASPHVGTATADGESFPVLVVAKGALQTKVYDLLKPPPVLRTFPSKSIQLKEGSNWSHANAIATYQDADLDLVLAFLRAVSKPADKPGA
jgi:mono/diheme cytochrome c family protein